MTRNVFTNRLIRHIAFATALTAISTLTAAAQNTNSIPGDPIAIDTGKVAGTILDNGVQTLRYRQSSEYCSAFGASAGLFAGDLCPQAGRGAFAE